MVSTDDLIPCAAQYELKLSLDNRGSARVNEHEMNNIDVHTYLIWPSALSDQLLRSSSG